MNAMRKSAFVGTAAFALLMVFMMPYTVTEIRNAAGMKTTVIKRCFITEVPDKPSSSFSLLSYEVSYRDVAMYLAVSIFAGAGVWVFSKR